MAHVNEHYLKLKAGYLFPEIARRVSSFCDTHADANVIRLGIGDVTEPLPAAIVSAMHQAVDEMAQRSSFRGYGPEQGYDFLRSAIAENDYQARGIGVTPEEIFVSDGSKCDSGNILDIFGPSNVVAITDPVYPVYVDTNVMAGHTGTANDSGRFDGLVYLPIGAENNFTPALPDARVDLIYLCYPNNPTGTVVSHQALQQWVDYAQQHEALILYDAAYEAYISEPDIPHSIYEIDGAREVAIEFRSFSKNAGFTGTRCAFTVVPESLTGTCGNGDRTSIHALWNRRQSTKFNGVSYVIQRGAAAAYSVEGKTQIQELVALLSDQRPSAARRTGSGRHRSVRRNQCALCVAQNSWRPIKLGFLRRSAEPFPLGGHSRQWIRSQRRRLFSSERFQQPREYQASGSTLPGVGLLATFSKPGTACHGLVGDPSPMICGTPHGGLPWRRSEPGLPLHRPHLHRITLQFHLGSGK